MQLTPSAAAPRPERTLNNRGLLCARPSRKERLCTDRVKPQGQEEAPGEEEARRVPRVHQRGRRAQDPLARPASAGKKVRWDEQGRGRSQ